MLKREVKKEQFLIYLMEKYHVTAVQIIKTCLYAEFPNKIQLSANEMIPISNTELLQFNRLF
jgi:hypothetical protein